MKLFWMVAAGVATIAPPAIVHNRVYVLVHNRGPLMASSVQVMAALTNASTVLSQLPSGYTANIQAGTSLPGPNWVTLGAVTLSNLRPDFPQVAAFDLPSNLLPLPASLPGQSHYCLVAFAHSAPDDPYTATQKNVDLMTVQERKVAQKNLHFVEFEGVPPAPSKWLGIWGRLDITGFLFRESGLINLIFDLSRFPGMLRLVIPETLAPDNLLQEQKDFIIRADPLVKNWYNHFSQDARKLFYEGKYS